MTAFLTLYHTPLCPFCVRVRYELRRLGISADLANLYDDPQFAESLIRELGRTTVPVLRIEDQDGSVTWMPESADIVRYLNDHQKELSHGE